VAAGDVLIDTRSWSFYERYVPVDGELELLKSFISTQQPVVFDV
jgi:hypothetical protein